MDSREKFPLILCCLKLELEPEPNPDSQKQVTQTEQHRTSHKTKAINSLLSTALLWENIGFILLEWIYINEIFCWLLIDLFLDFIYSIFVLLQLQFVGKMGKPQSYFIWNIDYSLGGVNFHWRLRTGEKPLKLCKMDKQCQHKYLLYW